MVLGVWANNRVFNWIALIGESVLVPIPHFFQDYGFVIELKVRDDDTSVVSFILQGCFNYPGSFVFPYKADYCYFKVCEGFCWNFMGSSLNL